MSAPASPHILIEALSVASLAAASYVSTNVDNLVVVSIHVARPGYRPLFVKATFTLVCLAVLLASFALAEAADVLPPRMIRWLGLIPITIGVYSLGKLIMGRRGGGEAPKLADPAAARALAAYLSLALILLSNSSDTLAVMTPLFADLRRELLLVFFIGAAAAAVLMGMLAGFLVRRPVFKSYVEKIGKWALPFLLIGIGLLIVTDEPADVFIE